MAERKDPTSNEDADVDERSSEKSSDLQEGVDYHLENGLMVFTGTFLQRRGYCCERGCRHCPYGFIPDQNRHQS